MGEYSEKNAARCEVYEQKHSLDAQNAVPEQRADRERDLRGGRIYGDHIRMVDILKQMGVSFIGRLDVRGRQRIGIIAVEHPQSIP